MKEIPILFSAPMVRAIRAGTKTQTRRICQLPASTAAGLGPTRDVDGWPLVREADGSKERRAPSPFGRPGDRLWMREAWRTHARLDGFSGSEITRLVNETEGVPPVRYEADPRTSDVIAGSITPALGRYRHARFMPRWACRQLLEVVDVRVQRLQAISAADAIAEGIVEQHRDPGGYGLPDGSHYSSDPTESYCSLWSTLHGRESLDADPFVWCVTFRAIAPTA